jgi:uncharacterized protein (TIGR03437 family)
MGRFQVSLFGALSALYGFGAFGQVTVNPQQIYLAAPAGALAPALQTVGVIGTGPNLTFNASVRYLSPGTGWLSVDPATGNLPAILTISADASKLAEGTHYGQVMITAGASGTYVNVSFTVGSTQGAGSLAAAPSSVTFAGSPGLGSLPSQTISVTKAGDPTGAVSFTAMATSTGWLSLAPAFQVVTTPAVLSVGADQTGLTGTRTGTITLTPVNGGPPTVIPVTLSSGAPGAGSAMLRLYQTALTINHQVGTPPPPVQTIAVTSSAVVQDYFASTATPWLRLTTAFSPTPSPVVANQAPSEFSVVAINPDGLAPGTHIGTVIVESGTQPPIQLPVSLNVTATPALNAIPSSLTLDAITGPELPVTIASTGSANLSFSAAASANTPWLSVTPASGSTASGPAVLTVRMNPALLAVGTHLGTVTLTELPSGRILSIPVRAIVEIGSPIAAVSTLVIDTTPLELSAITGGANPTSSIHVLSSTGAPHEFTAAASSAGGWLLVTPYSSAAPGRLTITANAAAVPPGTYEGSVIVTSLRSGATETIPVRFNLDRQAIAATPASLNFAQLQKGVAPPAQTLQLTANLPGAFTATPSANWLTVTPRDGVTPSPLRVSVNPTGLPPGLSRGTVRITGPNNEVTVQVSLTIPEPPAPTTTPSTIALIHELGSPAPSQPIDIGSTGDNVTFTAAATTQSGVKWLTVSPESGSTPARITASVNTALLVPGRHSATITVAAADPEARPRTVAVTLDVGAPTVVVQSVLHGATFAATPIAPGQIVSITGTGLGPATGVSARPSAAGAIESRLADIRVLFDGVPAPLLYVRNDQINAIVPYALHGRVSARVQVEAGTSFSIPVEAKVVDVAPGIFTINSGRGQAAALNSDLTVNSLANPAPRGTWIVVFGSGEGQTDPPGQDGRIILTDLRRPLGQVSARIGGRPAEIAYFGSAPALVSGVFQANLRIPEDIPPGPVPVEIQVGGVATQSGVTVVVR